jgi:hypothetical protein
MAVLDIVNATSVFAFETTPISVYGEFTSITTHGSIQPLPLPGELRCTIQYVIASFQICVGAAITNKAMFYPPQQWG